VHATIDWRAAFAARVMERGGVIAYPTEAVWGLGCDPFQPQAVERLLDLKQRPVEKGLILISGQIEDFDPLLSPLGDEMRQRFFEPQSRPTTWLVPDIEDRVPDWIKGEHKSVALRVVTHPVCVALTKHFGGPIVSTSANPAGKPSACTYYDVQHYFFDSIDYSVQAPVGGSTTVSQIKDLASGRTLRG